MLALLSPAKTLDFEPVPGVRKHTLPALLDESEKLVEISRRLSAQDLMKLMKIKKPLAELNVRRFRQFRTPFSEDNAKAAILAFRGDTYIGFDVDSLDQEALEFAQDHVRILSGLYGLLRPLDLMQAYRLEMGTKLKTERGRDLYAFWGDRINERINAELEPKRSGVIVNLASNEYIKAVEPERLTGKFVDCVFKEKRGATAQVIGFSAKRARGMMARFICQTRATTVEQLKEFALAGYEFQPQHSTETHLEFHRAS